jgi:hypothetical protein
MSKAQSSKTPAAATTAEECVALCDYDAAPGGDELSFKKHDIITVLAKGTDSGFWEGRTADGRRGVFPNCFVTSNLHPKRSARAFLNKAVALFDYTARTAQEMSMQRHDVITAVGPSSNLGWWYGINESRRRRELLKMGHPSVMNQPPLKASTIAAMFAPVAADGQSAGGGDTLISTGVRIGSVAAGGRGDPASAFDQPLLFPTNYVTCNLVVAAFPFHGRMRHELTLAVGDVVLVHRRWNDGWWEGSVPVPAGTTPPLAVSGDAPIVVGGRRRGIFPSNYTLPNVATVQPPLFCPKCRAVFPARAAPTTAGCVECGRNEEIVRTLVRTLNEHHEESLDAQRRGEKPAKLDLFAHVDLMPSCGPGALLSPMDTKDQSVRPRLSG